MALAGKQAGKVWLVGAGPGDPDLLTLKAVRALEAADVVIYDRLVSDAVLGLIGPGIARIDVGKRPRSHPVPQGEINRMLVALARSGRTVVRLKGGDPFLFGRGGEEAQALAAADIAFEVVPGITSAQGCAAALKMPLTQRGVVEGVRFVTGHCRQDKPPDFDWRGLADPRTTLVVYMGLGNIAGIASALMAHGRSPATPVMAVSRATLPDEQRRLSTLATIARDVKSAALQSPTLFVIGEVAALAPELETCSHDAEPCGATGHS